MLLFIILTLIIGFLFHEFYWKRRNFPPGPTPLPLIGNLGTIAQNEPGYKAFEKWQKEFGSIFTIWLGNKPMVIIADYELMKNTYVKDGESYIGKLHIKEGSEAFRDGDWGIVDTIGDMWKEHRRFALQTFRDLGLGKNLMQEKILYEVDALTLELNQNSKSGCEFSMAEIWDERVGNVINQVLFGYRFDENTIGEFRKLKSMLSEAMHNFADPMMQFSLMFPWTRHLPLGPIGKSKWDLLVYYKTQLFAFFEKQIDEITFNLDEAEDSKDYVEAYLKEKKRREEAGDDKTYCMLQLKNCLLDLWIAGLETTSNTLAWLIVYILNNPDVQTKMHEELDKAISSRRQITMSDKNDLPYVNAVINETQRLANLLPVNLIHELTRDVQIESHSLTRGTLVVAQIANVLYDEQLFPQPYAFKPERFLDENGHLKKVDALIPFSIGKRQCLGESLARMELFLFTANLFNRFELTSEQKPSLVKTFGTTMRAQSFNCRAQTRN